ncbi:GAF domain-containing protein [Streptomyces sp. EKS3.2]|uniref:GAF domain-containing protein n=1 Tax=Streptomyces sp. EKS3.2 TaxID=3461008 RepID=UPI00404280EC
MMQQASATDPAPGRRPGLVPDPDAETARIAAVRRYDILDTPPDGAFDRVAAMAARLFDVPVATVTIVDTDRIWFKAAHGLEGVSEIGRDPGLCGSAILRDDAMVIPDTLQDPIAVDNPLVAGEMGVRFYAAAPIITPEGHRLGTVNVLDTRPRSITEDDTATLADLAAIVLDEMELRLSALRVLRDEQARREAEKRHAEAERARAEAERAAREKAEQDKAAIAAFASTLQRTLLPLPFPWCRTWNWPATIAPPPPTTWAATSTTSSPSTATGGRSSSVTCAVKAPRRRPSPPWPVTPCAPRPRSTPTPSPC